MRITRTLPVLLALLFVCRAQASDCTGESLGLIPLNDLDTGLYLGRYEGGLYPSGLNTPPVRHFDEGVARALGIEPLDTDGNPSPTGKIVLLSMGMSNTTQEYCSADSFEPCDPWTFVGKAETHPDVNHETLVLVNGARAAQSTRDWNSAQNDSYDRVLDDQLLPKGLTEAQVQAIWMKHGTPRPAVSLPSRDSDAFDMLGVLGDVVRAVRTRYPNCSIIFISTRTYAGYATSDLSPEPYAYESGFAVKWLIEAQITQMAGAGIDPIAGDLNYPAGTPWLAWGPYLWADGLNPRSDGLIWECTDFEERDGMHPATSGEDKVATRLLDFMLSSPFSQPWFAKAPGPPEPGQDDFPADDDPTDDPLTDVPPAPTFDAGDDGVPNGVDPDLDGDGLANDADNCPDVFNPDRADQDGDGVGDACDADFGKDSLLDEADEVREDAAAEQPDGDQSGADSEDIVDADDVTPGLERLNLCGVGTLGSSMLLLTFLGLVRMRRPTPARTHIDQSVSRGLAT